MSDNNRNGGKKDNFAKPGDENIVSGKSFFLSIGKTPKGPSNPLLESEKRKNDIERDKKNPQKQADNKERQSNAASSGNSDKGANGEGRNKGNFKKHGKGRNDRRHGKGGKGSFQKDKAVQGEIKSANKDPQNSLKNDNAAERHGKDQRHDKKSHGKHDRHSNFDRREEQRQEKQNSDRQDKQQKSANNVSSKENQHPADTTPIRQKHKKEKFVPSTPGAPTTDDSLLQPIVNTTGIISGGKAGALRGNKRSKFGVGAFTGNTDDSKTYFDKTRPLAEQVKELNKPKTYNPEPAPDVPSVEVIGVRFREAGKVYYFAPGNNNVERGEAVIVETMRGSSSVVEYGFCAIGNRRVAESEIVAPLKPIVRKATKEDTERYLANKQLEESAAQIFREKVSMLKLEMSLVYVEYTFDNSKLLFYFTAEGRVDFRELIKELASAFRTRIELRQIGVRDEAKAIGGLGMCGRPVCCKSFLGEFAQVSIRMAKDQNLILNSSKISGTCGRFMCCIRYEDEVYQKEYEKTPRIDAIVETPDGRGIVTESNALKGEVKVLLESEPDSIAKPYKSSEVKLLSYAKRDKTQDDELEELPEEN